MSERIETSFSIVDTEGRQQTFRILNSINIDDMMLVMMKSAANELKNGVPYESPITPGIRDYLLHTRVALGS